MKYILALVVVAWCCVGSASAAPPTAEESAASPPLFLETARKLRHWDVPAEPAKIAGPIYFVGTKGLASYLITTSAGHILLHTGMPGSGPMIEQSIRKLGFKPEEIKILLTGHAHCDHAGGHAYLKNLSGGEIAMIREERELFESGGKLDFHYGAYPEFAFEPAQVDRVLRDGEEIKLGDVVITALLTGGHTKGTTTYVMNLVDGGRTYSVVFPGSANVNPGYRVEKNPSYPGIQENYRRTLRVLEGLKPDVWLDAHTDAFDYEGKSARAVQEGIAAWVDPQGYEKWLATARTRLEDAVARERR